MQSSGTGDGTDSSPHEGSTIMEGKTVSNSDKSTDCTTVV